MSDFDLLQLLSELCPPLHLTDTYSKIQVFYQYFKSGPLA